MSPSSSPKSIVQRCRAIIFDLDDTLYPEREFVLSGFQVVSVWAEEHLGIPANEGFLQLSGLFKSGVRGNTFDRWLEGHGFHPETYRDDLVRIYRTHKPRLHPFPEIPALLESLKRRTKLALLTDGHKDVQKRKLDALGIAQFLDVVVFSDALGREAWKPSTKPFEFAIAQLGIAPALIAYAGDNPAKDFFGAKQLGIFTIQIKTPSGEYCHLIPPSAEYAPDMVCNSFTELRKFLENHDS